MADFPWEILKAETLRLLSRELGIKRNLKREEIIAFLRSVQKKGLGPALADEITKDLTVSGSLHAQQKGINGISETTSSPTSPVSSPKRAPPVSSRRISTRKRPASEAEAEPEPLFLPSARSADEDTADDADSEGHTGIREPESISVTTRNRGVKRVRVAEVELPPARSTRSRKDFTPGSTSISAPVLRSSSRRKRGRPPTRPIMTRSISATVPERRVTRRSEHHVQFEEGSTDMDADGEDEVVEEEDMDGRDRFTGPDAVAAALTKASTESKTPGPRGRSTKSTSAPSQARTSAPRPKPRPAMTSRTRQNQKGSNTRVLRRTIKPTAKGILLSPSKSAMTVLNRPVHTEARRRARMHTTSTAGTRNELDAVIIPHAPASRPGGQNRSDGSKEVFDGVVLEKRYQSANPNMNGDAGGSLSVQLDEFVANGLVAQQDIGLVDPVLAQDDVSSLGGSNKENDFLFRNVSEGSPAPEANSLPIGIGEEDAEGEPEPEADTTMQEPQQTQPEPTSQPQPQSQQLPLEIPYVDGEFRLPLHDVLQPQPEPLEPIPTPWLQPQSEPQPEPSPGPGAEFQLASQLGPPPGLQSESQSQPQPVLDPDFQSNAEPNPQIEPESEPVVIPQHIV